MSEIEFRVPELAGKTYEGRQLPNLNFGMSSILLGWEERFLKNFVED